MAEKKVLFPEDAGNGCGLRAAGRRYDPVVVLKGAEAVAWISDNLLLYYPLGCFWDPCREGEENA